MMLAAPATCFAQSVSFLSCSLSVDDGAAANPPSTLLLKVSTAEYEDFKDGAWGRNLCGPHGGGQAPDVVCQIYDGAFRVDWVWRSNVGVLERHVLLDLKTGELIDRDHNGLEKKGVCRPTPDPSTAKPKPKP
jgi:hypothetical protein